MAFRPTIATYIGGKIGDIGYYRNWTDIEQLLFEAVAIAVIYGGCTTLEDFREKRFHRQKVWYSIAPELWENTQENLHELERCSEFPIVVDLTASCIYTGCGPSSPAALAAMPDARTMYDDGEIDDNTDFYRMLENCRIVIDDTNRAAIRQAFADAPSLCGLLSGETAARMREFLGTRQKRT